MAPKLSLNRLTKRFGELEALRDINVAIERGEFISLVGPSGCGKTTLLRIVAGLEPASAGEVLLDGRSVRAPGADKATVEEAAQAAETGCRISRALKQEITLDVALEN